jgi:TfoX/Sxy family transcriptional regulator of competence genes
MQIPKPSDSDKDLFRSLVPSGDAVEVKPMFGNLGAFVNGNMFAGLFGSSLGVRLVDDGSRAELAALDGSGPFGPEERPMGGYLALPPEWTTDTELATAWMTRAMTEVAELPPKAPKPAKKSTPKRRSS